MTEKGRAVALDVVIEPNAVTDPSQDTSERRFAHQGMPSFDRIRYRRHDANVFLYAFDLIELNGDDLRRDPLESRTRSPSLRATTRKPSCLISCSHNPPEGGVGAFVGRHGAVKPAGRVRMADAR